MAGVVIIPVTVPPLDSVTANIAVEYGPEGLIRLRFSQTQQAPPKKGPEPSAYTYLEAFKDRLAAYLKGRPVSFQDIPLDLTTSITPFRKAVWRETSLIPYGTITTYAKLARKAAGSPSYARAVGGALNANPLPIVIPCHRILAANGSLGGFGAGLDVKKALLALERSLP